MTMFCPEKKFINHLFFECSIDKYVWSIAAMVGVPCRPISFEQFWIWTRHFLPGGEKFFMTGLQLFARQRGSLETSCALKKKRELDLLLRSFVLSSHVYLIGQSYRRPATRKPWWREPRHSKKRLYISIHIKLQQEMSAWCCCNNFKGAIQETPRGSAVYPNLSMKKAVVFVFRLYLYFVCEVAARRLWATSLSPMCVSPLAIN